MELASMKRLCTSATTLPKCRLFSSLVSDLGEHTKHEFNNLLQLDDALPPSLRKETDKIRTIQANDINNNDDYAIISSATKISSQWNTFMATFHISESVCYLNKELRKNPDKFWMKVRTVHPELGNTMLYWLAHPVGTAPTWNSRTRERLLWDDN